ncbi:ornithine cyclodeaminase family protein [Bosea sp. (in: a-proteobacteria)]|jgi:ornithine cyclodeaminase/alanine dehydrogenase-like protein (mu-crystallin family)|uniref:ornithine cyclodeaminase family protein n=1 Tax=Bosea sp. (in: a-proteobacteria) TaxID=1871050 RepID=UPI003F706597
MRMIEAATVHRLLDWPGAVEAMRLGHLRDKPKIARLALDQPREGGHPDMLLAVPAWQAGEALGIKVVTSFPRNVEAFGLPTVDALYLVFDPQTGKAQAVIDGEALIFRKTASDSALGASFLAPPTAETMLMVGAGALAPYVIDAMLTVRPSLKRILIWNRTPERARVLAETLRAAGKPAEPCPDLDTELPTADIVIAATMAERPLVKGDLVAPGAHVGLIGSFTPEMREGDDALLCRAAIFVDDYACLERSGEFIEPLRTGVISRDDVRGDLFALCRGDITVQPGERPTLFKNGGAGHLDLFLASHLLGRLASADQR